MTENKDKKIVDEIKNLIRGRSNIIFKRQIEEIIERYEDGGDNDISTN